MWFEIKYLKELDCPAQSPGRNTTGMRSHQFKLWEDLEYQQQCLTLLMLMWLNGQIPTITLKYEVEKPQRRIEIFKTTNWDKNL